MQVQSFAKVMGPGDSNLGSLCSSAGCIISPPHPQDRGQAGYDVNLASNSVLGLVMGLNMLHNAVTGSDNLKRINYAAVEINDQASLTTIHNNYNGMNARVSFTATFFVRSEKVGADQSTLLHTRCFLRASLASSEIKAMRVQIKRQFAVCQSLPVC